MLPSLALLGLGLASSVHAVTVYSQKPLATSVATSTTPAAADYTGAAAYDPTVLNPPPVPSPAINTQFGVQLQSSGSAVQGLGVKQSGSFLGFSVEMSVANQVCEWARAPSLPLNL
jgi:hypothetical protein